MQLVSGISETSVLMMIQKSFFFLLRKIRCFFSGVSANGLKFFLSDEWIWNWLDSAFLREVDGSPASALVGFGREGVVEDRFNQVRVWMRWGDIT